MFVIDEECIPMLKIISDNIEKTANEALLEYDLTFSQGRLIVYMFRSFKESYSLKELENLFVVSQQTMSGIVARLEKKNFLKRAPDENDRRIKNVMLTDEGKKLGLLIEKKLQKNSIQALSCFSADELEDFTRLLRKFYLSVIE